MILRLVYSRKQLIFLFVSETMPPPNYITLLIIPIILLVAMGNVLVIVAVAVDRKLRSATNCFLSSLAVADLLVALMVMPPSLAMIINSKSNTTTYLAEPY